MAEYFSVKVVSHGWLYLSSSNVLFGLVYFETECSLAVSPRRTPSDRPRDLTPYDFRVRVYSIKSIYSILTIPKRSSRIKGRDPKSEEHPEGVCKRGSISSNDRFRIV